MSGLLPTPASPRRGLAMISTAGLLWGTTGVVVARLHERDGLDPVSAGFYRLAVAAGVLAAVGVRRPWIGALRRAPLGLGLTGVGLAVYQALYFVAVADAGVAVSTVVSIGIAPVVTTVAEALVARRRPDLLATVTVIGGVAGLVLVVGAPAHTGTRPMIGVLAATGSGLGFAVTALFVGRVARRVDAAAVTGVSTLVGALTLAPLAWVAGLAVPPRPLPLAAVAYLGVVTTALAYLLFYAGMRTTAGSVAAVLTLLEPLVAAVLAVVVLGERLTTATVVGGLLLLVAIGGSYRRESPA
jgi:drug/metabolite transporter, DME family